MRYCSFTAILQALVNFHHISQPVWWGQQLYFHVYNCNVGRTFILDSCHASRSMQSGRPTLLQLGITGCSAIDVATTGRWPFVSLRTAVFVAVILVAVRGIPGLRAVHPPCPTWYVFLLLFPLAPRLPDAVCSGQSESRSARLPELLPDHRHPRSRALLR